VATCASCGYEAGGAFRFCPECGTPAGEQGREQRRVVTVLFCDVVGSTALGKPGRHAPGGRSGRRPELEHALALYEQKGNLVMAERTRAQLA
jgi:hypothetical protein